MYLNYEEYKAYCGNSKHLPEAAFFEFEFQAEILINLYTFDRLKKETEIPENVKMCVFSLIKKLILWNRLKGFEVDDEGGENGAAGLIKSQSNDGVSVSYNVLSASEALENSKKEITDTIKTYLSGTYNSKGQSLTYRGMYPGEEDPRIKKAGADGK